MKKKILAKGYTISVTSWENDGDNYKTKSMTVKSKEEATAIVNMCKTLFKSCNNGKGGIGNTNEGDENTADETILNYVKSNPEILFGKTMTDEQIIEHVMNYSCELMGSSEYYYSRVFESCDVVYSESDVYSEKVKL